MQVKFAHESVDRYAQPIDGIHSIGFVAVRRVLDVGKHLLELQLAYDYRAAEFEILVVTRTGLRDWLRAEEVAALLGVTTERLLNWRVNPRGPAFLNWNAKYVIYNPRSVAYFVRRGSLPSLMRQGHPWVGPSTNGR